MANYNPPQPFWKRAVAGVLDLILAFSGLGWIIARATGGQTSAGSVSASEAAFSASGFGFYLEGWRALLLFALIVAYFVLLGRTGGTIFQRLFGFRRA